MQEHIYTAKRKKIIGQSWSIWLFVVMQIVFTIAFVAKWGGTQLGGLLFLNAFLSMFTIPGIILFIRYYRYAVNNEFIVTYNKLRLVNIKTSESTELVNREIENIIQVNTQRNNHLPWTFHEYFILIDSKGDRIIINSYTISLFELRMDTLAARMPAGNVEFVEKTYPIF